MEATNDYIVGFARSLKEKFERAEDGKAAIHIGEEKFIIYGACGARDVPMRRLLARGDGRGRIGADYAPS
jgi:hypothetical protein